MHFQKSKSCEIQEKTWVFRCDFDPKSEYCLVREPFISGFFIQNPSISDFCVVVSTAGLHFTCAIRADNGHAECWGGLSLSGDGPETTPTPDVPYSQLSCGRDHTCAIRNFKKILKFKNVKMNQILTKI